ncbi:MAG: hypothetical protein WBM40_14945 [Thiohalocapsa sp.]
MPETKKQDIITFKVDGDLREALERLPNRSEFIRAALRAALKETCPLCCGTGALTTEERKHWDAFIEHHTMRTCDDCHAVHLVCLEGEDNEEVHGDDR